jgi:hypothetical protein
MELVIAATEIDLLRTYIDSRRSDYQQSCRWSRAVDAENQGREEGAYDPAMSSSELHQTFRHTQARWRCQHRPRVAQTDRAHE